MIQKDMNAENVEIKNKAYELYEQHGFKDGNDFVDWLEAEKQMGKGSRLKRKKYIPSVLFVMTGLLCVIIAILLFMLYRYNPQTKMELSEMSLSNLKVMMLVLDQKADEEVVAFGDTHFNFDQSTLTDKAKTQLDKDVLVLNDNPKMKVRMAGYTSAKGTEDSNQILSEKRASSVRDYLIEKQISPARITTIGYGRTKPALYEVSPGDGHSKEAKANMRVLFEIVVQ